MAKVIDQRVTVEMEGEFVVFMIGMRINKPWKIHKWLPVLTAMPKMIKELEADPNSGFLGHNGIGGKVMEKLHQIDPVAYVRYVSVYRQFEDVGEFIREIQALERRASRDPMQRRLFKD